MILSPDILLREAREWNHTQHSGGGSHRLDLRRGSSVPLTIIQDARQPPPPRSAVPLPRFAEEDIPTIEARP